MFEIATRDRDRDCVYCLDSEPLRIRRPYEVGASLVSERRLSLFGIASMGVPAEQSAQFDISAESFDRGCLGFGFAGRG